MSPHLAGPVTEPDPDCPLCPRLAGFRQEWRNREPAWHNAPVPLWLPPEGADAVRLLIVGLAPGLKGANRTGRAFTGDASGDLLMTTLVRHGHAEVSGDGHALTGTAIVNAVRCVPPQNKPTARETATCRDRFLAPAMEALPALDYVVTLGRIAHDATVRALGAAPADHPFGHGAVSRVARPGGPLVLTASYHCSRYNVNTGRLTPAMFDAVFAGL